jgi:DNA helicase-2/ATP-dependent DNA helicase PcrA
MIYAAPTKLDALADGFNERQAEAYAFDGHCAVLAGPGSGKTRVLVTKVRWPVFLLRGRVAQGGSPASRTTTRP